MVAHMVKECPTLVFKQGCPPPLSPSPTLFGLYIAELGTYLDKFDGDSMCLFNTVVAILLALTMLFYSLNMERPTQTFEQAI